MSDSFNISSLIKLFTGYDSAGPNNDKIDTLLEYSKLGGYLNGEYVESTKFKNLSRIKQNKLKKLFNSVKDEFNKIINNPEILPEITDENVEKYINEEHKLYYLEYPTEEQEKMLEKIQKALFKYLIDNGAVIDKNITPDNCNFGFILKSIKKEKQMAEEFKANGEKTLKLINNPYDNNKLKISAEKYIAENSISRIETAQTDLGNGEFDKVAIQKTNTCWALAGINSLLQTEKGKKLLETNSYYDKKTGVFAIHLQEAEENGMHDGIYIVTPEEIAKESANLAEGDGDITAYLIAIEKYFEEVRNNPELEEKMETKNSTVRDVDEGNYNFRFFEILTGGQCSQYPSLYNVKIQNGIGNGSATTAIEYETIYDIAKNKNGASVLTAANHSISVAGVRNGNLLIQESNNNPGFAEEFSDKERNHIVFKPSEPINGAPAYELSKEDYDGYISAASFIRW